MAVAGAVPAASGADVPVGVVRALVQGARSAVRGADATALTGVGPASSVRPTAAVPVALGAEVAVAVGAVGQEVGAVGAVSGALVAVPLGAAMAVVPAIEVAAEAVASVAEATTAS